MVSFWPWRGPDTSPATFEKQLSALSKKITATQTQLDNARTTSRRIRVLWSLYLSFAYLVYAIVLFMVVGFKNLGPLELTGMAGGPVLIYLVRTAVTALFTFRIDTLSARLKEQQTERAKTIQKLKDATKYDTTLELLEKYGGSEGRPKKGRRHLSEDHGAGEHGKKSEKEGPGKMVQRTNLPPPPTANIARVGSRPSTPAAVPQQPAFPSHQQQPLPPRPDTGSDASAEFAPNAFGAEPPSTNYAPVQYGAPEAHWYDRIMDLLLGEDETSAKNRFVLICSRCRLVNGQAPPGTKSLADVGRWKCMACGEMNGAVDEGQRIVDEVLQKEIARSVGENRDGRTDEESDGATNGKEEDDESDEAPQPVKARQKGKKRGGK